MNSIHNVKEFLYTRRFVPLFPAPNIRGGGSGVGRRSEPEKQHTALPSEPHRAKPSSLPPPPRTRLELNVPLPPTP